MKECADGTNVPLGTDFVYQSRRTNDWFDPRSSQAQPGWRRVLERLQAEFLEHTRKFRPLRGVMTQKLQPCSTAAVESAEIAECELQSGTGGLGRELAQLFSTSGQPLFGQWPVVDCEGRSIINSAGDPFAFRLGFSRYHLLLRPRSYRVGDERLPDDGGRFSDAATEASGVLRGLPSGIALELWRNWPEGFRALSGEKLWLDLLHELGWRPLAAEPLKAKRAVWLTSHTSFVLHGDSAYPLVSDVHGDLPLPKISTFHGHPSHWSSTLSDLARASVAAIDLVLSLPEERKGAHSRSGTRSTFPPIQLLPVSTGIAAALQRVLEDGISPLKAVENSGGDHSAVIVFLMFAMVQRDALARALAEDARSEETQRERRRCAEAGITFQGRSLALAEEFERSDELRRAYAAAISVAGATSAAAFFLPKLEALRAALVAFIDCTRSRYGAGESEYRGCPEELRLRETMLDVLDHTEALFSSSGVDANGTDRPAVVKSHRADQRAREKADWPPDEGWQFRPGEAAFRGRKFAIRSAPIARLLERLATARRYLLMEDLKIAAKGLDPAANDPEDKTIRGYLSDLRAVLRAELGVAEPIPNRRTSAGTAWSLADELLPQ